MTTQYQNESPHPVVPIPGKRRLMPFDAPWALEFARALDERRPGFFREIFEARFKQRQAIFAAWATGILDHPGAFVEAATGRAASRDLDTLLAEVADLLMTLAPRDIVGAAFGSAAPDGYISCLSKAGPTPLNPEDYATLFSMFQDPQHARRGLILSHCPRITSATVGVVQKLHPTLLHQNVLMRVRSGDQAAMASDIASLALEFSSTTTESSISKAASDLGPRTMLSTFLKQLLATVDQLPASPVQTDPTILRPIQSKQQFGEISASFANCLDQKIWQFFAGRAAFYHYLPEPQAIAVLIKTQDQWVLSRVHAKLNAALAPGLRDRVVRAFLDCGVECLVPMMSPDPRMASVVGLCDPYAGFLLDPDMWEQDET